MLDHGCETKNLASSSVPQWPLALCALLLARPDAECRDVEYNHNESKKIHAHHQSDAHVHRYDACQPEEPRPPYPNENWIADFDQTDRNSEDRQRVFEVNKDLG
jgi:hypothetical protein